MGIKEIVATETVGLVQITKVIVEGTRYQVETISYISKAIAKGLLKYFNGERV